MAPILIDDSRIRSVGTYGPELNRELARISQHRIVRQDAINSVRDLWFLVYDDEDDGGEEDLYGEEAEGNDRGGDSQGDVEEEDEELQRAIELSLKLDDSPNGGDCSGSASMPEETTRQQEDGKASHEADDEDSEDEAAQLDYAIAMSLQEDDDDPRRDSPAKESAPKKKAAYPCGTCIRYPSFPFSKKASCFRVIRRESNEKQEKSCMHYLAISYCWSSTSRAPERSYRVRVTENDGTISERPNRVPDEIIDRAVELAKRTGIRLIWLDQECLPQDASREQELGVQAMDLVYSRALVTGGFLESLIPSQAHLDSVMTVLNWSQSRDTAPQGMPRVIGSVLPKDTFINCLLEFLDMLAFDPWNQRAWTLQESFSATKDVILNIRMAAPFIIHAPWCFEGPAPPGNLYMVQREVDALIKASQEFLELAIGPFSTSQLVENPGETKSPVVARAEKVFRALKQLRPEMPTTSNPLDAVFVVGGGSSGPRYKCNAAVALSFLRTRFNHRPADRLAILANLCSYEVRLDTVVIENNFTSLTTCLFCLAYINNDLSLLVPEVYQCFQLQAPIDGPSWAFPFGDVLFAIDDHRIPAGFNRSLRFVTPCEFTDTGIITPGHMWKVDRPIDLTPIQIKWKTIWELHTALGIECHPRENESREDFMRRNEKAMNFLRPNGGGGGGGDGSNSLAHPRAMAVHKDVMAQMQTDPTIGASISRVFPVEMLKQRPASRQLLGSILFEILRYLKDIGEKALANSIWHSIRVDYISRDRGQGQPPEPIDTPDDVTDLLNDQDMLSDPWKRLQLDHSNGTISETWLINRIMEDGMIWAGNCTTPGMPAIETEGSERFRDSSIARRQRSLRFLGLMSENVMGPETTSHDYRMNVANQARFAYMISMPRAPSEDMVATFDVDGPCGVFTPYDCDMESIPRSAIRSRSVCPVVERVAPRTEDHGNAESGDVKGKGRATDEEDMAKVIPCNNPDQFRVLGRVKGMWHFLESHGENYKFV